MVMYNQSKLTLTIWNWTFIYAVLYTVSSILINPPFGHGLYHLFLLLSSQDQNTEVHMVYYMHKYKHRWFTCEFIFNIPPLWCKWCVMMFVHARHGAARYHGDCFTEIAGWDDGIWRLNFEVELNESGSGFMAGLFPGLCFFLRLRRDDVHHGATRTVCQACKGVNGRSCGKCYKMEYPSCSICHSSLHHLAQGSQKGAGFLCLTAPFRPGIIGVRCVLASTLPWAFRLNNVWPKCPLQTWRQCLWSFRFLWIVKAAGAKTVLLQSGFGHWTFAKLMWSLYIPYIHIWYVTVMLTVGQHLFFSRHVWRGVHMGHWHLVNSSTWLQHFRFPELSIPILLCISPMSFSAKSWNWPCCIWLFSTTMKTD